MLIRSFLAAAAIALALSLAALAHAEPFDLIYVNHFDLTLCSSGCGITLTGGNDFALFVSKSATDIDLPTFNSIRYTVVSSVPDLELVPYAFSPGPTIMPIKYNEAVGNITSYNSILLTQLLPGEVFRDAGSNGTLGFSAYRHGPYEGPVTCHVTMRLGQDVAAFDILFDFHLGQNDILFLSSASRASSMIPTAAARSSWGKIKALYR